MKVCEEGIAPELKDFVAKTMPRDPFLDFMGCELLALEGGRSRFRIYVDEKTHINRRGTVHGGVLGAFSDIVMGWACRAYGYILVTISLHCNYIRPVQKNTYLYGEGRVIHKGKKTMVTECEFRDEEGTLIVKGQGSFFVIKKLDLANLADEI